MFRAQAAAAAGRMDEVRAVIREFVKAGAEKAAPSGGISSPIDSVAR